MPRRRKTLSAPPSPPRRSAPPSPPHRLRPRKATHSDLVPKLFELESKRFISHNSVRTQDVQLLDHLEKLEKSVLRMAAHEIDSTAFLEELKDRVAIMKRINCQKTEFHEENYNMNKLSRDLFRSLSSVVANVSIYRLDNFFPPNPNRYTYDIQDPESIKYVLEKRNQLDAWDVLIDHRKEQLDELQEKVNLDSNLPNKEYMTALAALNDYERCKSLQETLIPFVAMVEVALQYFQYRDYTVRSGKIKDYLQQPSIITNALNEDPQLHLNFNRLSDAEVHAVIAYSTKVHYYPMSIHEDPLLGNPIFKLVSETLKEDYVMDVDPIVELEKIMKSDPRLYDNLFRFGGLPKDRWTRFETKEDAKNWYSQFRVDKGVHSSGNKDAIAEDTPVRKKGVKRQRESDPQHEMPGVVMRLQHFRMASIGTSSSDQQRTMHIIQKSAQHHAEKKREV